jgi:hypothetical protein
MKDKSVQKLIKKQLKDLTAVNRPPLYAVCSLHFSPSGASSLTCPFPSAVLLKHDKEKQATEKTIEKKLKKKG